MPRPEFPPLAHTGGFGEPTCQACHVGDGLNAPGGELRLEGVPRAWQPGTVYPIAVVLRRDSLARAGFELSARFQEGGAQAGRLAASDSLARVTPDTARHVEYAHHTLAGNQPRNGIGRWVVLWTAPQAQGEVVFHAAAVAGNDDNSNLGDVVYTRAARTRGP